MADDKKDADIQRGKDSPEEGVGPSAIELLGDIKESLLAQTESRESSSADLGIMRDHLASMRDMQDEALTFAQKLAKATKLQSDLADDEAELKSVADANRREEVKEELSVFDNILSELKRLPMEIAGALKATGALGGGGGNVSIPGAAAGGAAGSGFFGKVGSGAAGAVAGGWMMRTLKSPLGMMAIVGGLAALLIALAPADLVASQFRNAGENLSKVIETVGTALGNLTLKSIAIIGALGLAGAIFGKRAGIGLGVMGAGLAAFFVSLGAAEYGIAWMDLDYSELPKVTRLFSESVGELDQKALITMGTLLGVGSIFGPKAGLGIGSIGAGIAGFFLALGATDKGLDWMNIDGERLKTMIMNMTDALGYMASDTQGMLALGGLLTAGAIFGAVPGGTKKKGQALLGMGAIGLGIGAFFAGLGAGDAGLNWMNSDGSNLKSIMVNIAEGLGAFASRDLAGLLATGGIFAAVSAIPGGTGVAVAAALGLGIAGLGIGAFVSGMAVGGKAADMMGADGSSLKKILTNMAEGLTSFNTINAGNLMESAKAIALLGPAMISLMAGRTIDAAGQFVSDTFDWATSWFRDTDGPDQIDKMVTAMSKFGVLNSDDLRFASENVDRITKSLSFWGETDPDRISENIRKAVESLVDVEGDGRTLSPIKIGILLDTGVAHSQIAVLRREMLEHPITTGIQLNVDSLADQLSERLSGAASVTAIGPTDASTTSINNSRTTIIKPDSETVRALHR